MKILHIGLCGPVTEGLHYQDNILPKYHVKSGHDVTFITSQFIWNSEGRIEINKKSDYINEYGVKIIRLPAKYNAHIGTKIKLFKGLYNAICNEKPDIIFVHGCQFLDIKYIVKYRKKHKKVKIFVDNHADFSNSATNWISKHILHKMIWKYCAKKINPYTTKFYGVLPARVDFLINMYGLPKDKVELLVMGADDDKVALNNRGNIRSKIRKSYNIDENDFLIITGGKIDSAKRQTLLLMEAIKEINKENVKLLIFGSVSNDLKEHVDSLSDGNIINYIGWINSEDVYDYFVSSDLAVFPGRHSVLWEQAVGTGVPCVFKYWEGTTHVDLGGNCEFLFKDSKNEIKESLIKIINNNNLYENMKNISIKKGISTFSYQSIADKSINY